MKKMVFVAALAIAVSGCNQKAAEEDTKPAAEAAPAPEKTVTAADVIDHFKKQGLPISDITVYTAENDPNKLLGRPNQYVAKANFFDTRHPADEANNTVEIFASEESAKARRDYVEAVTKDMPMLVQYQFLAGNILIRLDKAVTPAESEEYRKALDAFAG
ncbi:hypothetical protein SAMN06295912_102270 [Sphingomonas laterariae]|uniref:Lipoprotein n=1 Tax=Edaphosphingomonas laterariae TaxID=861865 RepID=A0A239CMT8_9SPHN|nr:lipoprotein [Sphingomonas laterariae]SNS20804.1 hypothetical protein SAMN06295912_102270 [Sphingomonas laterariae]